MTNLHFLIALLISDFLTIILAFALRKERKKQIAKCFYIILILMFIWTMSLTFQILLQNSSIPPVFFEGLASFGAEFTSLAFLALGIIFAKSKIKLNKKHLLLLIIPVISIILMLTNNYHHLYYVKYSTNLNSTIYGPYMTIHSIYSYLLFGITIILLLRYSIKNAGFFSKQALLIITGTLIPIVANVIGYLGIIPMTVYITPICFSFTILFFALAIFKFKFLSVTPIAMQRIVDRISDSFLVLNEDNVITDFNDTFIKTFNLSSNSVRNQNFIKFIQSNQIEKIDIPSIKETLKKCKTTTDTYIFARDFKIKDKYFNIEINGIYSKNSFLGTIILLKDVTQHVLDMQTIEDNQSIIMEQERLASLGQMIGGIAHNLKTPIMSISGALEGLTDLITEYNNSIEDSEVTPEDHHEIASDMTNWINKIKTHLSYMSDVISAIKGQAVSSNGTQIADFTVDELIKQVQILMKHELSNSLTNLNISINIDPNFVLRGNINSLIQVINNMISNSIQAYGGKQQENIYLNIYKKDNNIIISIKDYAGGLPEEVKDKLFKEMITTKGKNGTGLGLFMSHSNIKAHFNGNITFESEAGKGTVFNIILPV